MDIKSYLLGKKSGGGSTINNQNKSITINQNGTTSVSADAGYTGLGTVGITTNVTPDLESKSVTINSNTTTVITPSIDKDGLSQVSVTTNVEAQPDLEAKSVTITENGTTIITPTTGKDGMSEVEVTTNVSGGGDKPSITDGDTTKPGYIKAVENTSFEVKGTKTNYMFHQYPGTSLPALSTLENIVEARNMFSYAAKITAINVSTLGSTQTLTTARSLFSNCRNVAVIDVSGLEFTKISGTYGNWEIFENCGSSCLQSDGAYADGIPYIYVKDATQQNWVLTNTMNSHPSSWTTDNVVIKQ